MIFQRNVFPGGGDQLPQRCMEIGNAAAVGGNIEVKGIGKTGHKIRKGLAAQSKQLFPGTAGFRQRQEVKLAVDPYHNRNFFLLIKIFPHDIFQQKFIEIFFQGYFVHAVALDQQRQEGQICDRWIQVAQMQLPRDIRPLAGDGACRQVEPE